MLHGHWSRAARRGDYLPRREPLEAPRPWGVHRTPSSSGIPQALRWIPRSQATSAQGATHEWKLEMPIVFWPFILATSPLPAPCLVLGQGGTLLPLVTPDAGVDGRDGPKAKGQRGTWGQTRQAGGGTQESDRRWGSGTEAPLVAGENGDHWKGRLFTVRTTLQASPCTSQGVRKQQGDGARWTTNGDWKLGPDHSIRASYSMTHLALDTI